MTELMNYTCSIDRHFMHGFTGMKFNALTESEKVNKITSFYNDLQLNIKITNVTLCFKWLIKKQKIEDKLMETFFKRRRNLYITRNNSKSEVLPTLIEIIGNRCGVLKMFEKLSVDGINSKDLVSIYDQDLLTKSNNEVLDILVDNKQIHQKLYVNKEFMCIEYYNEVVNMDYLIPGDECIRILDSIFSNRGYSLLLSREIFGYIEKVKITSTFYAGPSYKYDNQNIIHSYEKMRTLEEPLDIQPLLKFTFDNDSIRKTDYEFFLKNTNLVVNHSSLIRHKLESKLLEAKDNHIIFIRLTALLDEIVNFINDVKILNYINGEILIKTTDSNPLVLRQKVIWTENMNKPCTILQALYTEIGNKPTFYYLLTGTLQPNILEEMNLFTYFKLNPKKKKISFQFEDKIQNIKSALLENIDFYKFKEIHESFGTLEEEETKIIFIDSTLFILALPIYYIFIVQNFELLKLKELINICTKLYFKFKDENSNSSYYNITLNNSLLVLEDLRLTENDKIETIYNLYKSCIYNINITKIKD